jgi:succinate-acetate transporter protein
MNTLSIIFIVLAIVNIILAAAEWISTGEQQFSRIGGWFCAILYCISSSIN